jgi:hypothetical protein
MRDALSCMCAAGSSFDRGASQVLEGCHMDIS